MMTRHTLFAIAVLTAAVMLPASNAMAVSISYDTPTGATVLDGVTPRPVDARATFTTGAGTLTILLENFQTNIRSVAQNVSDLTFTLSNSSLNTASFAVTGNSAKERTVAADGTFTNGSTLTTASAIGWVLTNPAAGTFHLDDLVGTGHAGPAHTLIGPPDTATQYTNANNSIAGNGPHNPFLAENITWALNITGITDQTTITAVTFSFGTEPLDPDLTVQGVPSVPEPSTFLLLGSGLAGLAGLQWRTRARRAEVAG